MLSANLKEPFLVADGCVTKTEAGYAMHYIFGTSWLSDPQSEVPERVYKIGVATSVDLISWRRTSEAIISNVLGREECQAYPAVFDRDGQHHMIFAFRSHVDFRQNPRRAYRLGHATSDDLVNWSRDDGLGGVDFPREDWDQGMRCYPSVFQMDGRLYLLYNGNDFGKRGFGLAQLV